MTALSAAIEEALRKKNKRALAVKAFRTRTGSSWTSATSSFTCSKTTPARRTTSTGSGWTLVACRSPSPSLARNRESGASSRLQRSPWPTRERFVRSIVSDSPVARPMCRRHGAAAHRRRGFPGAPCSSWAARPWWASRRFDFGWAEAPVQPVIFIVGYIAGCAAVALALSMLIRRSALRGSLPFAPASYVFPVDLVDARTRQLVLYPLSTLQAFDVMHHSGSKGYTRSTLRFVFPTTSFTFESRDRNRAEAEATASKMHERPSRRFWVEARRSPSWAAVDPFVEARARRFAPARDHGLLARGRPTWTCHIWLITLLLE